jgi:hypothetical protein
VLFIRGNGASGIGTPRNFRINAADFAADCRRPKGRGSARLLDDGHLLTSGDVPRCPARGRCLLTYVGGREAGAGSHFLAPLDDLVCVVAVLVVSLVDTAASASAASERCVNGQGVEERARKGVPKASRSHLIPLHDHIDGRIELSLNVGGSALLGEPVKPAQWAGPGRRHRFTVARPSPARPPTEAA